MTKIPPNTQKMTEPVINLQWKIYVSLILFILLIFSCLGDGVGIWKLKKATRQL